MTKKVNITRVEVLEPLYYFTWVYIHYDVIGKNGEVVSSEKSWKMYGISGVDIDWEELGIDVEDIETINDYVEDMFNCDTDNFGLDTICRSSLGDGYGYDEADIYSFMKDEDIDEILNIDL